MFPWQNYNPNAFVECPEILDEIQGWVDDPYGDRQVLSLVAPPGTGKSWLLRYLKQAWQGERLVIWVNAVELVNPAERKIRENILNHTRVSQWLENTFSEAKQYCSHIPSYTPPPRMTYGKNIELLVTATCQRCELRLRPVVLVDGYDDIEAIQAEVLSDQLLTSFISDECWRMIIARRAERSLLAYKLKNNSDREVGDRLRELFSISRNIGFARQQFRQFLEAHRPDIEVEDESLVAWFGALKEYHWGHPFINAFLFDAALRDAKPPLPSLTKKDLEDCFRATVQRRIYSSEQSPSTGILPRDNTDILKKISNELDETWTDQDLDETLGIKLGNESERLFESGIIIRAPDYSSRYKIADGLRELLREIKALP